MDVHAGKPRRQGSTLGGLTGLDRSLCSRCQLFELFFNRCNVGVNCLVEQTDLIPIELLAAAPEFPALERGQLVGEFVDLGLAVSVMIWLCCATRAINSAATSRSCCAFRFWSDSSATTMPNSVPARGIFYYWRIP